MGDEQIAHGLELASPDLADGLERWARDPDGKRARSAERSLVRYLTRLASRPDLFGVAGAYSLGEFADAADLELGPRSELDVRTRVDSGLLRDIVRRAASEAADDPALMVKRNPAVYRVGGRLRVAARKPGATSHRLVEIRPTAAIELALERAADGAPISALVATLAAAGTPEDHAPEVIRRLLRSDLLMPVADVTVTGPEPTDQAGSALASLPGAGAYAAAVESAVEAVAGAPTVGRELIDAVSEVLAPTGVEVKRRHCLQVDSSRPRRVRLPQRALGELRRSVNLLASVTPATPNALDAFKQTFERRFATRSVPLLEALDPDFGIRLASDGGEVEEASESVRDAGRRRVLLELMERGRREGAIELTDADVAALSPERSHVLPASFSMLTSLIGGGDAAVAAGDFQIVEPTVVGPSGARLLGRLCRGDVELERLVRTHLSLDAAHDPDAIYAELSLAPETEAGLNITQRPLLRDWEIDYGGGSGAPADRRLAPSDLVVSVEDDDIVLRSATLGRRVVPSCSTAMNPMWVSLPAARFLLSIAQQRITGYYGWSWDELDDAPELPRVSHGRTILYLRRWNAPAGEFAEVRAGTDAAGFRRLREWRVRRGLPRLVSFDHPKNRLVVDFDNVLSVDAFLASTGGIDLLRFIETTAGEPSPVHAPDGRYAHELIVPFTLAPDPAAQPRRRRAATRPVSEQRRRFQPGSEWLYANLYGPVGAADRVLVEHVAPLARALHEAGLVDRWFFIRYADPGRHLRVRFHGNPRELLTEALPALNEATAPALADGLLYRISLDTYEREVERYGGIEGVELMEQAAAADSEAVVRILEQRVGALERRHLAVASLAALYEDSGLPLEARRACCVGLRNSWAPPGIPLGTLLGSRERSERAQVAQAVADLERDDAAAAIGALRERSSAQAAVLARLSALEAEGVLERSFQDVMCSLAHMSVNRLLRRGANLDEVRVHDALARLYEGQIARERSSPVPAS